MALPGVNVYKKNGNAVPTATSANKALIIGPVSGGNATLENTIYTVSNTADLQTYGYGPAQELAGLFLSMAPPGYGSVDVIFANASIAPVITLVSAANPTITVTGTPTVTQDVRATVVTAGTTGSLKFKYSRDGGNTYTDNLSLNGSSTYTDAAGGITFTFAAGTHASNNSCVYDIVGPSMNTTNLAACINTLSTSNTNYTVIGIAEDSPSPVTCSALFGALDGHLTTLAGQDKPTMFCAPCGGENTLFNRVSSGGAYRPTNVLANITGSALTVGNFAVAVAERANTYIAVPLPGYAKPRKPIAWTVGAEIHAVGDDISKSILQSPIRRIETPSYDERQYGEVYKPEHIIAPTTRRGIPGIYTNGADLKYNPATAASYNNIPKGRVANKAVEVAKLAVLPLLGQRVAVRLDGTGIIAPADKSFIEATVNKALSSALLEPTNGNGDRGHCSGCSFSIVETNLLASPILYGKIIIVPFAYIEQVEINIFFNDIIV